MAFNTYNEVLDLAKSGKLTQADFEAIFDGLRRNVTTKQRFNAVNEVLKNYGMNLNTSGIENLYNNISNFYKNYNNYGVQNAQYEAELAKAEEKQREAAKSQGLSYGWKDTPMTGDESVAFITLSDFFDEHGKDYNSFDEAYKAAVDYLNSQGGAYTKAYNNAGLDSNSDFKSFMENRWAGTKGQAINEERQQDADTESTSTSINRADEAANAYQQSINAGVSKSNAGMLGDASANAAGTSASYNALQGARGSTQKDYLEAMGQYEGLSQNASNAQKGVSSATAAGALQGAATGATTGFLLSDERAKERPTDGVNEESLLDSMQKYLQLVQELKSLKGKTSENESIRGEK